MAPCCLVNQNMKPQTRNTSLVCQPQPSTMSVSVRQSKQQKRRATDSGDESAPKRPRLGSGVSGLATDAMLAALEFLNSASLLAATLVCPGWNEIMAEAGKRAVQAAERAWLPVCPAFSSRPKTIPVERFYRLQYLGSLGVWCPRPGHAVISATGSAFPLALPQDCSWDAVESASLLADVDKHVVVRVNQKKELVVATGDTAADAGHQITPTPAQVAAFALHWPDVQASPIGAQVGPWAVSLVSVRGGMPACHYFSDVMAVHAETLVPCEGAHWEAGSCTVIPVDLSSRRLVSVSPSCAVLYTQPRPAGKSSPSPFVPRFVLWCSARSGTDELLVCRVPDVTAKRRRLNAAWDIAPHDFQPAGATLAYRGPM